GPQLHDADGPPVPPYFSNEFDDSLAKRVENESERSRSDHARDDASIMGASAANEAAVGPSMAEGAEGGSSVSFGGTSPPVEEGSVSLGGTASPRTEAAAVTVGVNPPSAGRSTFIAEAYRVEGGTVYEAELAEPQSILPFYQRKGFCICQMITVTLLSIGIAVVTGVLLSKSSDGPREAETSADGTDGTLKLVPGEGDAVPQTSSPSEEPVSGMTASIRSPAPTTNVLFTNAPTSSQEPAPSTSEPTTPFFHYGYQSDSTHSWEYREKNDNGGSIPSDPSSFVGSVHYEPLHHALYVTGGTFASQVLDRVDVYEVGVEEAGNKDGDAMNEPVGVPGWSPTMGDCFYAVFALPTTEDVTNSPDVSDVGKLKLVHSRRFGSDGSREACSAVDVLFASSPYDLSPLDRIPIRSVRLLMAGHVESENYEEGYLVSELPRGMYNEASVYAFAQLVDIRMDDHPQSDFEWIVTTGVESRALLNDMLPSEMRTVYPVSLVADPVSKSHYYVAMLASNDGELNQKSEEDGGMEPKGVNDDPTTGEGASARSYTDYDSSDGQLIVDGADDRFGLHGRPVYGSDYRIILKKMSVEKVTDPPWLDDLELVLAGTSANAGTVSMRHQWMEEFSPERGEDARPAGLLYAPGGSTGGEDDVLVMVGTTAGRGARSGHLDGFVTKVRTDTGAFAGGEEFDAVTGSFLNTDSERIASDPGQDEIVTGVCAKPLRTVGDQDKTEHVYVVGGTSAKLPAIPPGTRDSEFEQSFGKTGGGRNVFGATTAITTTAARKTPVCSICSQGLTVDGSTVVPNSGGQDCSPGDQQHAEEGLRGVPHEDRPGHDERPMDRPGRRRALPRPAEGLREEDRFRVRLRRDQRRSRRVLNRHRQGRRGSDGLFRDRLGRPAVHGVGWDGRLRFVLQDRRRFTQVLAAVRIGGGRRPVARERWADH
ncbi:hypothetical protein THAOC_31771, partial [Thalassiosira oceanica]